MMELWTGTGLMLGLLGSLHCMGMCGPLAIALPRGDSHRARYVGGRLLYNLGRVVTYSLMGAIFGLLGQTLVMVGVQRWVSVGLGIAMLILLFMGPRLTHRLTGAGWITRGVGQLKKSLGVRLKQNAPHTLLTVGLLNGLLPCGLVYVALTGAAATGSPLNGALYMALFGLGTIPIMFAISLMGHLVFIRHRTLFRRLIPIGVSIVAAMLILRGLALGIPYLSPDLAAGSSCH